MDKENTYFLKKQIDHKNEGVGGGQGERIVSWWCFDFLDFRSWGDLKANMDSLKPYRDLSLYFAP